MNSEAAEAALSEMLPYFEAIETQSTAILQLLKDKNITSDGEFAEYLERAGSASGIRWQGARLRMERLFASSKRHDEESVESAKESKTEPHAHTDGDRPEENKGEVSRPKAEKTETAEDDTNNPNAGEAGPEKQKKENEAKTRETSESEAA